VFYTKPGQKAYTLENGDKAIPTYGLFVDRRKIQAVEDALGSERRLLRYLFPVLGVAFIGLAFMAYREDRRRTSNFIA
jgi:hypothetical protein